MLDIEAKVSKLEIEVSAIKEKVSFFSVIYDKFDSTIDKIERNMEERRQSTNNDLKDVYRKINDTEQKIMTEILRLREDMARQHQVENKKIDDLNKWRWIVMGAAAAVGWIISKVLGIK